MIPDKKRGGNRLKMDPANNFLCFSFLPDKSFVWRSRLDDGRGRFLFLFPAKQLSQQKKSFSSYDSLFPSLHPWKERGANRHISPPKRQDKHRQTKRFFFFPFSRSFFVASNMADGDVCVPLWEHTPSFAIIPLPPFLSFLFLMDDWCVRKTEEEKTSAAAASIADKRLSHIRGQRTKVFPQKTRKINIQKFWWIFVSLYLRNCWSWAVQQKSLSFTGAVV